MHTVEGKKFNFKLKGRRMLKATGVAVVLKRHVLSGVSLGPLSYDMTYTI